MGNVILPPLTAEEIEEKDAELSTRKWNAIQKAAEADNVEAYAKLIYAGALPIQWKNNEKEPPAGLPAFPSTFCPDSAVHKSLFVMVEGKCKAIPDRPYGPVPIPE